MEVIVRVNVQTFHAIFTAGNKTYTYSVDKGLWRATQDSLDAWMHQPGEIEQFTTEERCPFLETTRRIERMSIRAEARRGP